MKRCNGPKRQKLCSLGGRAGTVRIGWTRKIKGIPDGGRGNDSLSRTWHALGGSWAGRLAWDYSFPSPAAAPQLSISKQPTQRLQPVFGIVPPLTLNGQGWNRRQLGSSCLPGARSNNNPTEQALGLSHAVAVLFCLPFAISKISGELSSPRLQVEWVMKGCVLCRRALREEVVHLQVLLEKMACSTANKRKEIRRENSVFVKLPGSLWLGHHGCQIFPPSTLPIKTPNS